MCIRDSVFGVRFVFGWSYLSVSNQLMQILAVLRLHNPFDEVILQTIAYISAVLGGAGVYLGGHVRRGLCCSLCVALLRELLQLFDVVLVEVRLAGLPFGLGTLRLAELLEGQLLAESLLHPLLQHHLLEEGVVFRA